MRKIKHKAQPNGVTCVHACLAMALDKSVYDVINDLGDHPINLSVEAKYLVYHGVFPIHLPHVLGGASLPHHGVYLATTPSLNKPGKMHRYLFTFYKDGSVIYDPAFDPEREVDDQPRKYHHGSIFQAPNLHFFELTYLYYDFLDWERYKQEKQK